MEFRKIGDGSDPDHTSGLSRLGNKERVCLQCAHDLSEKLRRRIADRNFIVGSFVLRWRIGGRHEYGIKAFARRIGLGRGTGRSRLAEFLREQSRALR